MLVLLLLLLLLLLPGDVVYCLAFPVLIHLVVLFSLGAADMVRLGRKSGKRVYGEPIAAGLGTVCSPRPAVIDRIVVFVEGKAQAQGKVLQNQIFNRVGACSFLATASAYCHVRPDRCSQSGRS